MSPAQGTHISFAFESDRGLLKMDDTYKNGGTVLFDLPLGFFFFSIYEYSNPNYGHGKTSRLFVLGQGGKS